MERQDPMVEQAGHPVQSWLSKASLQELLSILNRDKGQARIAGGAVRNALLGEPVNDIDIATTLVPRDVILRMNEAGHKTVPTGIEHGTVTAVVHGDPYEVTTLREDIETDGRHARVIYGMDWEQDARRRDLTMNALYMNADGTVFDPLGAKPDVLSQNVRFIDDAQTRIQEDYLRILRFFRFFAWYGKFRPDSEGLKACTRLKNGLGNLSAERVWHELTKLLAAPDPARALLWMRQTGVLNVILPETVKWGIDAIPGLIRAEGQHNWSPDMVLRLMAIIPPQPDKIDALVTRLKISNKLRDRLTAWANAPDPDPNLTKPAFYRWLYRQKAQAVKDRLRLAIARENDNSGKFLHQLKWLEQWQRPQCPVRGRDLVDQGMKPGPQVAEKLRKLEEKWIRSDFRLSREDLLA